MRSAGSLCGDDFADERADRADSDAYDDEVALMGCPLSPRRHGLHCNHLIVHGLGICHYCGAEHRPHKDRRAES